MVLYQCPERVNEEDPFNLINIRNNKHHYYTLLFNFAINFAMYYPNIIYLVGQDYRDSWGTCVHQVGIE